MNRLSRAIVLTLVTVGLAVTGLASAGAAPASATCNQQLAKLLGPLSPLCH